MTTPVEPVEELLSHIRRLRLVQREHPGYKKDRYEIRVYACLTDMQQKHNFRYKMQPGRGIRSRTLSNKQLNVTATRELLIHRKHSTSRLPPEIGNPTINWEETVCLNFLLQRFHYRLTMIVSTRSEDTKQQKTLSRCDYDIYCSPSRRTMDQKGSQDVITYPDLYFTLDNFEDLFSSIIVPPGSSLRLELVASADKICVPIFSGQVGHGALVASYARHHSASHAGVKREFLQLTGPNVAVGEAGARPAAKGLVRSLSQGAARVFQSMVSYGGGSSSVQTHLNACITYVSLPWSSLLAALLHSTRRPALTRAPGPVSSTATPVSSAKSDAGTSPN